MKKIIIGIILAALGSSMFSLASNVPREEYVQSEPIIRVESLVSSVTIYSDFNVNVIVDNIDYLFAFGCYLSYDTTVLDSLAVVVQTPFEDSVEINETGGYVAVFASLPPGYNGLISGTRVLFSVTFEAAFAGNSTLHLYNTMLIGQDMHSIPHTTVDTTVTVYESYEGSNVGGGRMPYMH
jgi:hypothetical protein